MPRELDLGAVLTALAHPSRRQVVVDLVHDADDQARACGSFDLPVSKATKTHHFKVLREAGLVTQRDHGNGSTLTLRRAEIDRDLPGLIGLLLTEDASRAGAEHTPGGVPGTGTGTGDATPTGATR